MPTATEVQGLLDRELRGITDSSVLEQIEALLVPPYPVSRGWDYGAQGQTYVCWTVLEHHASNSAIAYCPEGFGPSSPWGLLFLSGPNMSIGMDSGWFTYLEDAFRDSMAFEGENPPGYEVR